MTDVAIDGLAREEAVMPALSTRDRQMMTFLARYQAGHGYAPAIREVQAGLGISSSSVTAYRLNRLEELGLIERVAGKSRALRIVGDAGRWLPEVQA